MHRFERFDKTHTLLHYYISTGDNIHDLSAICNLRPD